MRKLINQRFTPYFYELGKQYNLKVDEVALFGFIYNHCENLRQGGYFGYSNESIAEMMNIKVRTIKEYLKTLKDKKLIIIENAGSKLRKIYINAEAFTEESGISSDDVKDQLSEIERLKAELKEKEKLIQEQSEQLKKIQEQLEEIAQTDPQIEMVKEELYTSGIYSRDENIDFSLLEQYKKFINKRNSSLFKNHIKYIVKHTDFTKIQNKKNYLIKSLLELDKSLKKKDEEPPKPKRVILPSWFDEPKEELTQEEMDELLKQALECQNRIDEPINEPLEDIDETDYNAI